MRGTVWHFSRTVTLTAYDKSERVHWVLWEAGGVGSTEGLWEDSACER